MPISYQLVPQRSINFNQLVGMKLKDFEPVLEKLPLYGEKRVLAAYKRTRHDFKLEFVDDTSNLIPQLHHPKIFRLSFWDWLLLRLPTNQED